MGYSVDLGHLMGFEGMTKEEDSTPIKDGVVMVLKVIGF